MDQERAEEILLENNYTQEQIDAYMDAVTDEYGPAPQNAAYWNDVVVTPAKLLEDMKLFVEALELEAGEANA